jgi:hypothetical protein
LELSLIWQYEGAENENDESELWNDLKSWLHAVMRKAISIDNMSRLISLNF